MNTALKNTLLIVITALVVGVGTYAFANQRSQTDKDTLNSTISSLQEQVNSLEKQVASSTTATTDTKNSTTTTTSTDCTTANLVASLDGTGGGTAGTYYYTLQLKNNGTSACTYSGTTTVSLLDKNGKALKSVTSKTASSLSIAAGSSIYGVLNFPNAGNYAAGTCTAGVTTLAVYAPGQTDATTVSHLDTLNPGWTDSACPSFSVYTAFSLTKQ